MIKKHPQSRAERRKLNEIKKKSDKGKDKSRISDSSSGTVSPNFEEE